jgi:EAL domain-containing protein (putative c-di-GMP-specific phosphodiesterase class I)
MEAQEFRIGEQPVTLTCTVGVCSVSGMYSSLEELISAVVAAHGVGKKNGGNCVFLGESTDADTRMQRFDAIWVKRIRAAFKENRFRLAQLPIAGLRNDSVQMYDMLIRMIDEQGNPIVPTEFLPAAERNNLMKTIDRWIFSAALEYCAENSVDRAFVRLSRHSMLDTSLVAWMQKELNKRKVDPASIAVQFPEQDAARYIKYIRKTVQDMQKLGVQFALEHYGVDQNRIRILDILKPNYIKIDGELMHALMTDTDMQDRVRAVAEAAEQRNIETIAERVENANAMAVLFQVGVHYMQGHYVHEPEVVLQEPVNVATTTLEAIANN